MRSRWMIRGLKFFAFAVVVGAVLGLFVMQLWNWLVPPIFGWQALTFWQALGLLLLSRILLGRLPGGPGRGPWRRRMMERWEQMTPEEREKFREGMRGGCRPGGRQAEPAS